MQGDPVAHAGQRVDVAQALQLAHQVSAVDHRREDIAYAGHDELRVRHDGGVGVLQYAEAEVFPVIGQQRHQRGVDVLLDKHPVDVRVPRLQVLGRAHHDGLAIDQAIVPGIEFGDGNVLEHDALVHRVGAAPFVGVVAKALLVFLKDADAAAAELLSHAGEETVDIVVALGVGEGFFDRSVQGLHMVRHSFHFSRVSVEQPLLYQITGASSMKLRMTE